MIDLEDVYRRTLAACAPDILIRKVLRDGLPRNVVAIGKCAGALLDGFGEFANAFVAIPSGYPRPGSATHVVEGGHPEMNEASFAAGRLLLDFVDTHDDITFLISGGGSACVDWPLPQFSEHHLIDTNARLIRAGLPIAKINCVRKHLSAIKGGRLAARVKRRHVTLVYSDVSRDRVGDVASGPTIADSSTRDEANAILNSIGIKQMIEEETPKTIKGGHVELIADNDTLTSAAATIVREMGYEVLTWPGQIELDVDVEAHALARAARSLRDRSVMIVGGEPTVKTLGDGNGGRCTELAARFALEAGNVNVQALFGSSDGVDGNSGAAGAWVHLPASIDRDVAGRELARSNSMAIIETIGRPLPLCPTGNNLRDLYLLACS